MKKYIIFGSWSVSPLSVMKAYKLTYRECIFVDVTGELPRGIIEENYIKLYTLYDKKIGNYEKELIKKTKEFDEK